MKKAVIIAVSVIVAFVGAYIAMMAYVDKAISNIRIYVD